MNRPPFAELIEEYTEPNPKQKGKYICPVCGGNDLSVGKNGKWDCYGDSTKEHRREIADWLNDRYRQDHPEIATTQRSAPPKSERQRNHDRQRAADMASVVASAVLESKVEELAYQFDPAYGITLTKLQAEIAAWAKSAGQDAYTAKIRLKEKIEQRHGALSTPKLSVAELGKRIQDLLTQDLQPSALEAAKIELRSLTPTSEREFDRLWQAVEEERDSIDSKSARAEDLNKLLSILSRVDSPSACGVSGIKKLAVHTPSACGGVID
jgi:hypothetical protein